MAAMRLDLSDSELEFFALKQETWYELELFKEKPR